MVFNQISFRLKSIKCVTEFANLMNELLVLKETTPLEEFIVTLIDRVGLKEPYEKDKSDDGQARLENINEMIAAVRDFALNHENATLEGYLENVSLVTDLDRASEADGFVTMMTLHSAKGLEFENVFIPGLEENIFPSMRSLNEENRLEEERLRCDNSAVLCNR